MERDKIMQVHRLRHEGMNGAGLGQNTQCRQPDENEKQTGSMKQ